MSKLHKFTIQEKVHQSLHFAFYQGVDEMQSPLLIKGPKSNFPQKRLDDRTAKEFELSKNLQHNNIIRALSLEASSSGKMTVMEGFDGIPLENFLVRKEANIYDFLAIGTQIASIVSFLHQSGIVHRDIHPNVFWIDPSSLHVKLVDWGYATKVSQEKQQLVHIELLDGELEYISPEQTGRMNRTVDYRTDLYSLGVLFFRILFGKVPFASSSPLEIIHAHIAQKPALLHELSEDVPKVISEMVSKLLSKNAEDRYQSAEGLLSDLNLCIEAGNNIFSLEQAIAQQDFSGKLQIPQKLYGREHQIESLLQAFERIQAGKLELVQIEGYSGVGKTSLVYEIHRPVTLAKGYFIEGKADQLMKSSPYLPWIQALTNLIDQLLAEEESQLVIWAERVQQAIGDNGQVLTDVIPNLTSLIGEQPDVPVLEPTQAQNRFNYVFKQFTHALTADEHPLVLFLDDMQWADAASLSLIKTLLVEDEVENLLVILSYRSNEVSNTHPLMLTMEEVYESTVSHQKIVAENLSREDLNLLIGDTLNTEIAGVKELTDLVFEKTQGNAFFVKEFLKSLYDNRHLSFSFEKKKWKWSVKQIAELDITNNVVELLEKSIQKLPNKILDVLKLAACIGNRFDEATLSVISNKGLPKIHTALEKARIEGYLEKVALEEYKFTHDRIHQTFYKLIPEHQKQATHVKVGQLLFSSIDKAQLEKQIFTIANHWNTGIEAIQNVSEREQLFKINLQAAQKAKSSNAYQAANNYLESASVLSETITLEPDGADWFVMQRERAEIAYLLADYNTSEAIIHTTLKSIKEVSQEMELQRMLILQYTMTSKFADAIEVGRTSLQDLGIEVPRENLQALIGQEIGTAFGQLGTHPVKSLLQSADMTNEQHILATKLLASILTPSFLSNQELFAWIVTKIVTISMEYGNVPASCFGYGCFGLILSTVGNYEKGFEFGELAYELAYQYNDPVEMGRASFHLSEFTSLWIKPFEYVRQFNRKGFLHALDGGDLQYAGYLSIYDAFYPSYQEKDIATTLEAIEESLNFNGKTQNIIGFDTVQGLKIAMFCLGGQTASPESFDINNLPEEKYLTTCTTNQNVLAICIYNIVKAQVCYHHGYPQQALNALEVATPFLPYIAGMLFTAEYSFYEAMSMATLYSSMSADKQEAFLEKIKACQEKFKTLADSCPESWLHKYLLITAELAVLNGKPFEAIQLYRDAIENAKINNFRPMQGLGNDRLAQLWLKNGDSTYAAIHLREALYAYLGMGAKHKVKQLEEKLAKFGLASSVNTQPYNMANRLQGSQIGLLDIESVLKASQALSSEIVLDRLLAKMMAIVMENAGAEKGYLLHQQKGKWYIEVKGGAKGSVVKKTQINEAKEFPELIIKYVARTKEYVVIPNAVEDKRFYADKYIIATKPKSILCTPLTFSGNRVAVLYLENNLLTDAFTDDRVELLKVLSSQMAISLDNALLYQTMEEKVKERTTELEEQRNQSEKLLLNILPEETARELKEKGFATTKYFKKVSVLFSDFKGFTITAEQMSPEELVSNLDYCFKAFDRIMKKYGLEKIKTIGDSYMAAGGIPVADEDNPQRAIKAGLEIVEFMKMWKEEKNARGEQAWEVRVGIHTGSVVAGVVGENKFAYDIWGDTVNLASRMESSGEPGRVNISDATYQEAIEYEKSKANQDFDFQYRGEVAAKNKGNIGMWFVKRKSEQ